MSIPNKYKKLSNCAFTHEIVYFCLRKICCKMSEEKNSASTSLGFVRLQGAKCCNLIKLHHTILPHFFPCSDDEDGTLFMFIFCAYHNKHTNSIVCIQQTINNVLNNSKEINFFCLMITSTMRCWNVLNYLR